jgi:hypothetical protein
MSRSPPPALGNRVRRVPLDYPDRVQIAAVLWPLLVESVGPHAALRNPNEIVRQTAWTRLAWRAAATRLAEAGWGTLGMAGPRCSLGNAISCPIAFVMTVEQKGRPCQLLPCPFCRARAVRRTWERVDRAFFPPLVEARSPSGRRRIVYLDDDSSPRSGEEPKRKAPDPRPARSPFDLYYRAQVFRMGPTIPVRTWGQQFDRPALECFLASRSGGQPLPRLWRKPEAAELLAAAGPRAGLLEGIRFAPAPAGISSYTWEATVRQVLLVPSGAEVPPLFSPHAVPDGRRHWRVRSPSRKVVCGLVARTLRYEPALLGTDVAVAMAMLDARKGRKLVASYGALRKAHC